MKAESTCIVVTTIQGPTGRMRDLAERAKELGLRWIIVGDRKGPEAYDLPPAELLDIDTQWQLPFRLAKLLPEKHYTRKNLGYLVAMRDGSERIFETDDDNGPMSGWRPREREVTGRWVRPKQGASWVNIYGAYSREHLWPRGLPLDRVRDRFDEHFAIGEESIRVGAPIQQGLANGSPDVDAVWRLVLDQDITFQERGSLLLPRGVWSPFNSQNTWWWPEAFPLLYLPSFCTFRMTDIWRSFVAQRCLWELGHALEFHDADMFQERNEHRLLDDFRDEIDGYLRNEEIRSLLESLPLHEGRQHLYDNLRACYEALAAAKVVGQGELDLVDAWIADCGEIERSAATR